jgi:hypothetical protein
MAEGAKEGEEYSHSQQERKPVLSLNEQQSFNKENMLIFRANWG